MAAYQAAGERRGEHHRRREGQRAKTGLKGRQSTDLLQVQRIQEKKAGETSKCAECQ